MGLCGNLRWCFILFVGDSTATFCLLRCAVNLQRSPAIASSSMAASSAVEHSCSFCQFRTLNWKYPTLSVLRTWTLFQWTGSSLSHISPKIHLRGVVVRKCPSLQVRYYFLQWVFVKHPSLQHLIPVCQYPVLDQKEMQYHSEGNDLEFKAWADHRESSKLCRKCHHPNLMVPVLEGKAF